MQTQRRDVEEQQPTYLSTEQLYRAHRPFVARFLTRLGVRPEALDDAVQEVFVTVHRRGGYVLGPAKPTSYLATIAINTAAAQRRSSRKSAARRGDFEPEDLAARGCDPGEVCETREELHRLDRALAKLDPTLRDTLLAADGEGETCVAISDATSVPLGTVYWRLDRARKKFREALRVVDAPQRRRLGMFVAWLNLEDLRRLAKKLGGAKGLVGASVMVAGFTMFALREPVAQLPVEAAAPVAQVAHKAAKEAIALPEVAPLAAPMPVEEASEPRVRRAHRRRTAPSASVELASVAPSISPPATKRVEAPQQAEPRAEPEVSETLQLARAEALLVDHPREALQLLRAIDRRENANYLREERDYIEAMALLAVEPEQGRKRAAAFLKAYPGSAFARLVQAKAR